MPCKQELDHHRIPAWVRLNISTALVLDTEERDCPLQHWWSRN